MRLEILSPVAVLFEGDVISVSLPGIDGEFQLLDHHAAIITALKAGELKIKLSGNPLEIETAVSFDGSDKSIGTYSIKGGVVEMADNRAVVLTE